MILLCLDGCCNAPGAHSWPLCCCVFERAGEEAGAGTDADVFVEIRGDLAAYGPHLLAAQKGAFETGSRDVFSLTTPNLGAIQVGTGCRLANRGDSFTSCLHDDELLMLWSLDVGGTP